MDDPGAPNPTKEAPRERTGVRTRAVTTAPLAGQSVTPWLVVVLVVVLFSGGLFGYDQGVISGALHGIKATFSLSALLVEVVTSWVTLGALFGALAAGELADQIGRKRTVLIAGAMFTLGALVQALAPDTVVLVAGRLIVGAGVGVAAVAAPLYAAELAPTAVRGRFVSAYQLAITIGIFLAYLVDGWLSEERCLADHAGGGRRAGAAAVRGGAGGAEIAALADDDAPPRRCGRGTAQDPPGRRCRAAPRRHRDGVAPGGRPRLLGRGLLARMATSADDRDRARRLPADHRHQRDHLLCRPDLRLRRLCHAIGADDGDHLGDRRRQRARHADRHRLHRPSGTAQAAAHRADRHGDQPGRGRHRLPVHRARPLPAPPRRRDRAARASSPCSLWSASSSASPSRWGRSCGR